jgi:hypothetical protein
VQTRVRWREVFLTSLKRMLCLKFIDARTKYATAAVATLSPLLDQSRTPLSLHSKTGRSTALWGAGCHTFKTPESVLSPDCYTNIL